MTKAEALASEQRDKLIAAVNRLALAIEKANRIAVAGGGK